MFCENCGKKNLEDNRFCIECGNKLVGLDAGLDTVSDIGLGEESIVSIETIENQAIEDDNIKGSKQNKKEKKKYIAIVSIIIVLLIGILGNLKSLVEIVTI